MSQRNCRGGGKDAPRSKPKTATVEAERPGTAMTGSQTRRCVKSSMAAYQSSNQQMLPVHRQLRLIQLTRRSYIMLGKRAARRRPRTFYRRHVTARALQEIEQLTTDCSSLIGRHWLVFIHSKCMYLYGDWRAGYAIL